MAHRVAEGVQGSKKGHRKICTCIMAQDNNDDDVVMHEIDCSFVFDSLSEDSEVEDDSPVVCVEVQLTPPAVKPLILESRIEEIRRKNIELLERFQEVEEDRRWAEQRGATLPRHSIKLVQTAPPSLKNRTPQRLRSKITPQPCIKPKSNRLENITITITNDVAQDAKRTVLTKSSNSRRPSKLSKIQERLGEVCDFTVEAKEQLFTCTINSIYEGAVGGTAELNESTSEAERRDYLRWKERDNRWREEGDLADLL